MIKRADQYKTEPKEKLRDGKGTTLFTELLGADEFIKGKCRLFVKLEFEPGHSIGFHPHDNEEEIYYITKGRGLVNDNGNVTEVGVGDIVVTGNGDSHSIEGIGDENLELVAFILTY